MKSSSGYEIYHNTLSSVLDEVERYVQSKGYEVGDYFPLINHVSYGTTEKTDLEMLKSGKIANNLKIQIYRMESGKYELNCYPIRKFEIGGKFATGGGIKSIKIGDKFHYKFDGKDYEVLGIENSKIVLSPIPLGSYWNNKEISFSLMNKWIIEKTMRKI